MIIELKFYVRRRKDRGHHLIKVFVDYAGLPPFAIDCIPQMLIDQHMQEYIWNCEDCWQEYYHVRVIDILEETLSNYCPNLGQKDTP